MGEVEDTKAALVALMRAIADGIEDGSLTPRGFSQTKDYVTKSHGKLKVNIPEGSAQFMLVYEKP